MYTIQGRVFKITPEQSGIGHNDKEWHKRMFAIETMEQYSKLVAFIAWNNLSQQFDHITIGTLIEVKFTPSSREYQDKFYTDLRADSIRILSEQPAQYHPSQDEAPMKTDDETPTYGKQEGAEISDISDNQVDDLPF